MWFLSRRLTMTPITRARKHTMSLPFELNSMSWLVDLLKQQSHKPLWTKQLQTEQLISLRFSLSHVACAWQALTGLWLFQLIYFVIIGVHAWGDFKDFIIILSHGAFTFFIPKTFSRAFFQCFALFCIFAHLFPVLSTVGHFLNDLNSARLGEKDPKS